MHLAIPFKNVIHIPSFSIVKLLCCGGHFSSITFIDAKTKHRSPYLLDVCQPYLQNHIRTSLGCPRDISEGRPHDVGRTRPLGLQIRPIWERRRNVARDVAWRYIQDIMGTSSGRMLRWDVLRTSYFNVQRTSVEDVLRTSAGDVPWRYIEDHMGTSIGRLRDIILPSGQSSIKILQVRRRSTHET